MNILTIDTVLDKTYVGFLLEGDKRFFTLESDENYHSAYLAETLSKLPLDKINYIGANTGVGSFTGIRVGLTIARVIADRLNIKAVPFNTFEALMRVYNTENVMLDARRRQFFYSKEGKIELISYKEAEQILDKGTFICDNALLEKFEGKNLVSFEKEGKNPAPFEMELVIKKIKEGKTTDFSGLKPTYVQTPPVFIN